MLTKLIKLNHNESITVNNARKDLTEFLIYQIQNQLQKCVVFVNEGISTARLKANFAFLNPSLKVLFVEESVELYNFSSYSLQSYAGKIKALNLLQTQKFDVVVLDYRSLLKKLPPKDFFLETIKLKIIQKYNYGMLVQKLFEFGFTRCETVFEFGEFAVRGFIIDVGTHEGFIRVEFEGDTVTSICKFSFESQRKVQSETREELEIYKIKECVNYKENSLELKKNAHALNFDLDEKSLQSIKEFASLALYNFLPLYFAQTANILSFLPDNCHFITTSNLKNTLQFFMQNLQQNFMGYKSAGRQVLSPQMLVFEEEEQMQKITPQIQLCEFNVQ